MMGDQNAKVEREQRSKMILYEFESSKGHRESWCTSDGKTIIEN